MDKSRLKDLERLRKIVNDSEKSKAARYRADRTIQAIIAQSKDRTLRHMREALVQAAEACDEYAEWKISCQIKDYLHEKKLELPV